MAKTIILKSNFLAYVALVSFVSISSCDSLTEAATTSGFTIDLIHIDSPQSPFYDPSLSPSQRVVNSIQRSFNRVQRFRTYSNSSNQQLFEADIFSSSGDYLMRYSIGTSPVSYLGTADTGSDLTWVECQPCIKYTNKRAPPFQPKSSSTYSVVPCNSPDCKYFKNAFCSRSGKQCIYTITYGDESFSRGYLAIDTFTFASRGGKGVSIRSFRFGCGIQNNLKFQGAESGVVGLGAGRASLITQLGPSIQWKFSYCLVSYSGKTNSSKLNFGANGVVSGGGVVSTPLVIKNPATFYHLTLVGISVGNQRIDLFVDPSTGDGNIIIDSGTTLTMLPTDFYARLERVVESLIKLKRVKDPQGHLNLCYLTQNAFQFPDVIIHFRGADVKLKYENVFVRTSANTMCLAVKPMHNIAVYGTLAQTNFLVGYDILEKTVSFKATSCGR